jgi:hypothetical protein
MKTYNLISKNSDWVLTLSADTEEEAYKRGDSILKNVEYYVEYLGDDDE